MPPTRGWGIWRVATQWLLVSVLLINSGDLLCNILAIVNNTVLCTLKFKRLNLTLNVLTTRKKQGTRRFWEVLDMFIALTVVTVSWGTAYVQAHQIVHIKHV